MHNRIGYRTGAACSIILAYMLDASGQGPAGSRTGKRPAADSASIKEAAQPVPSKKRISSGRKDTIGVPRPVAPPLRVGPDSIPATMH